MPLLFPSVDYFKFIDRDNKIIQNFGPAQILEEFEFLDTNPFGILSGGIAYYFVSNINTIVPPELEYVLLISKKPTRKGFTDGTLKMLRWLKHPMFRECQPEEVINSWAGQVKFIKEDMANGIAGLRPPQIGALFAIMAHTQFAEDRAIVVMPTGTGKTEVMLSSLLSIPCTKLLVTVPSDALRTQLGLKFITLGLLQQFGVISGTVDKPIVGIMANRIEDSDQLSLFIDQCNVIITTMPLVVGYSEELRTLIAGKISHLFVDEAHHSEAFTWSTFISYVKSEKVFLFTATPFRSDDRRLQGRFIFNFPLRAAQRDGYYKKMNLLPVREYDPQKADQKIAERAVKRLIEDRQQFQHILLARCANKKRAQYVASLYEVYTQFRVVLIYTGAPALAEKMRGVKSKEYDIIVCVDMLGEGFDLPELKIAAIHDERQGIPITLQFIGRFTRASFDTLGEASFITNLANPPLQNELDRLYAHDADWNILLPDISREYTERQINFQNFLDGFNGLEDSAIPFQSIRPAMSATIYANTGYEWSPNRWRNGISGIDNYDHQFAKINSANRTIVIILGQVARVDWGSFDTVMNMQWDMIVVYWDLRPDVNRICINYSMDNFNSKELVTSIFSENNSLLNGMNVFRIFHEVKRLAVYNFGGRPGAGRDISFRAFSGRGVQDGLSLLEQGTLIKNNIFGAGYKDGEQVSLGCSVKGKVWSYERGNLQELTRWFEIIGDLITDETIDPDVVLRNTLSPQIITERPSVTPIAVDWPFEMFNRTESAFVFTINSSTYDLSNTELNIVDVAIDAPIRFSLDTDISTTVFEYILGERTVDEKRLPFFEIIKVEGPDISISYGSYTREDITVYFEKNSPIFWFANGGQLTYNQYIMMREHPGKIPLENIVVDAWPGVNLRKESQDVFPYERDSIQYYWIAKVIDDFDIIYDDDASGEIADIIAINENETFIDLHLYHLKFALDGVVSNQIDNFYQVSGQAQKSLMWKHRGGREFFNHLLRRITKTMNGNSCSRLIKGANEDLERLLSAAKWDKELRFNIYIVQPGFRKSTASEDILLLLGVTYHYLATVGNVNLKVYSS